MCEFRESVIWGEGLVDGLFRMVALSKVEPSKVEPKTVARKGE
jgi:hypothetical protein